VEIELVEGRIDREPGRALARAQQGELLLRYDGDEDIDAPDPDHLAPPEGRFWIAYTGDRAVACGGFRFLGDGTAEVKRMYTVPDARSRGIGRRILQRIEDEARALGYVRLVLETGVRQPEAIALYEGAGFVRVPCWGEYAGAPRSVCLAKYLTT
jgi:GNAT superfamily N-acetyltransferase